MRAHISFALLILSVLVVGCGPRVAVTGMHPAEVGLPGVEILYVMPFSGEQGFDTRRCLLEELRASDRFRVLDSEIDERPQERWAGVRGQVESSTSDDRGTEMIYYDETTYRDVTYYDEQGNPHRFREEVVTHKSEQVEYVNQWLELQSTLTVESDGGIVDTQTANRSNSTKYGGQEAHPESPFYDSSAPTLANLGNHTLQLNTFACDTGIQLARRMIPEAYVINVPLSEEGGEIVELGVALAEEGNWPMAVAKWEQALALDPANAGALYNLGVDHERRGGSEELQTALVLYRRAQALDEASIFADGVKRALERLVEAKTLESRRGK
ncbi:MAG: tetratricopeptide repeat protein [Proteobacteria bacterium]|nr:tetratricopeptide repeat protein [Pseudomonadota bacterium]